MKTQEAMKIIRNAIHNESDYTWGWHCNIAMAAHDEGLSHAKANLAAARFMKNCWDIDMTKSEFWNVGKND